MGDEPTGKRRRRIPTWALFLGSYAGLALLMSDWVHLLRPYLPAGVFMPLMLAYFYSVVGATAIAGLGLVGRALGLRKGAWAVAARRFPTLVGRLAPPVPGILLAADQFATTGHAALAGVLKGNALYWMPGELAGELLGMLGMMAVATFASRRAMAAPMEEAPPAEAADPAETVFSAVAVTLTTRAAVAGVALLPVALMAAIFVGRLPDAYHTAAIVAYLTATFGTIIAVRRVSRIKVGLDGVYVTGSGPATFHAWTSVDAVRAEGGDIVLARGGRVVLRLQLHGRDVARKDALVARFFAAMDAAAATRGDATHQKLAHAASGAAAGTARFVASAHGAVDYRVAAVNREQLWDVVEGAAADPSARVLAAEALAGGLDDDERARLRVAAEHCAEPKVRVALEELLEDGDEAASAAPDARELPRPPAQ